MQRARSSQSVVALSKNLGCKTSSKRRWALCMALVLVVPVLVSLEAAYAEQRGASDSGAVMIEVRTLKARHREGGERSFASAPVALDPTIEDLRGKLQKLHFTSFTLLGTDTRQIELLQKVVMPLANGDTLAIRPLEIAGDRVGLWLKWRDRKGSEVLDTRMHFNSDESVVTGTDSEKNCGVVLAIKVSPR